MRLGRLVSSLFVVLTSCVGTPRLDLSHVSLLAETRQVVLVTTDGWDETAATVELCQLTCFGWRRVGAPIPARVGRSGLGWGLGLHADGDGPQKVEGDGRAPAGVFVLGPAFGYAPTAPDGVTMPYREATERDYFVDDPASPAYNEWQRIPAGEPNDPALRWGSCERMRRDDHQYEIGMVVGHNTAAPVPGRGSAIFLHVWRDPDSPTSGCTAMAKDDLLRLLRWLRPDANPLLLQVPNPVHPSQLAPRRDEKGEAR